MTNGLLLIFMFLSMAHSFTPSSRLSSPIAATITPYGTFHSIGLNVSLAVEDDPDGDATAVLEYRKHEDPYQEGLPLARIGDTRFVGSIFWLESGTQYDVRVTFSDPDGDPIDGRSIYSTAATRREIVIPEPINSYFVSPSGSGSECSKARPCTLTDALRRAGAGDEVVLRGGIYYHGQISTPRSGMLDAPIVIRGFSGETAVLDGADPGPFTWTPLGQGIYRTELTAPEPHLILANGQRLYPYRTLADLERLRWDNISGFFVEGATLYVHLAGDRDPRDVEMVIARHNRAFYVEQNFIYFLNLTFRHYGQGNFANAIYFNDASDNLVQNSIFASNDVGIGLKAGLTATRYRIMNSTTPSLTGHGMR